MANQEAFALPNLTKVKETTIKNKTLINSIKNKDLSFLQEFLLLENRDEVVSSLPKYYKCSLILLLVEFLDQPLRLEAINCIYEIMNDTGNVDAFSRVLIERSVDFNKLVFLKGKIDWLKYQQKPKTDDEIENEYTETD